MNKISKNQRKRNERNAAKLNGTFVPKVKAKRVSYTLLPPEMSSGINKYVEENLFLSLLSVVAVLVANTHILEDFMIPGLKGIPSDILVAMVFLVHLLFFFRKDKAK